MQHARRRTITGGWETGLLLVALVAAAPAPHPAAGATDVARRGAGGRAAVEAATRLGEHPAVRAGTTADAPRPPVHTSDDALFQPAIVPSRAEHAYDFAASVMATVDPACSLSWTLLAAIGGVESDHGRAGEAVLRSDGVSVPAIRGPVLDGRHGLAAVADTDAGELDGNDRWDRAMGPMQLLPTVWRYAGVDADDDGWRSPYDIDDAALAAGVVLCAGDGSLAATPDMRRAVHRYNPSRAYVDAVLALERAYRNASGVTGVPVLAATPAVISLTEPRQRDPHPPAPPRTRTTTPDPSPTVPPSPGVTPSPSDIPSPSPSTSPSPSPSPSPSTGPTTSPTPSPSQSPTPSPPASPSTTPGDRELTGVLLRLDDGFWTCGSEAVDLGDPEWLASGGSGDLDGDGSDETRLDELLGLEGQVVTLTLSTDSAPPRVLRVNGLDLLPPTP